MLGKGGNRYDDPSKVIIHAERHPDQFRRTAAKDGYRIVKIEGEAWKVHEDDYLAVRSGRLRPLPNSYIEEDWEKELAHSKAEKKNAHAIELGLRKGKIKAVVA